MLELNERAVRAWERIAGANEALIQLATEERDSGAMAFGPPFCPHCSTVNPKIRNDGGDGAMADFVLAARCATCGEMLFAVAQGWAVFKTPEDAVSYQEGGNGNVISA